MNKELEAFTRIMETYGKTNSLEGTYDDFLTIKRALLELKTIKEANPNEALEVLDKTISPLLEPILAKYEDDLSDRITANYFALKQTLVKAQENEELKVDICEMFGLDNLFPYNDTKAILKELEEYMNRKNQLWVDFMKISKELKEQKKVLNIVFKKNVDIIMIRMSETLDKYNLMIYKENFCRKEITQEEFDLLKEVLG